MPLVIVNKMLPPLWQYLRYEWNEVNFSSPIVIMYETFDVFPLCWSQSTSWMLFRREPSLEHPQRHNDLDWFMMFVMFRIKVFYIECSLELSDLYSGVCVCVSMHGCMHVYVCVSVCDVNQKHGYNGQLVEIRNVNSSCILRFPGFWCILGGEKSGQFLVLLCGDRCSEISKPFMLG